MKGECSGNANLKSIGLESSPEKLFEMLFTCLSVGMDADQLAKRLGVRFSTLSELLKADQGELEKTLAGNEKALEGIKMFSVLMEHYDREKHQSLIAFESMKQVAEYCINRFAGDRREQYYMLLLDDDLNLLGIEVLAKGDGCSVEASLDKMARAVYKFEATGYVLVHNHPGKSSVPSDSDIELTRSVYSAFVPFNKRMMEHLIVSEESYTPVMQYMRINSLDFIV